MSSTPFERDLLVEEIADLTQRLYIKVPGGREVLALIANAPHSLGPDVAKLLASRSETGIGGYATRNEGVSRYTLHIPDELQDELVPLLIEGYGDRFDPDTMRLTHIASSPRHWLLGPNSLIIRTDDQLRPPTLEEMQAEAMRRRAEQEQNYRVQSKRELSRGRPRSGQNHPGTSEGHLRTSGRAGQDEAEHRQAGRLRPRSRIRRTRQDDQRPNRRRQLRGVADDQRLPVIEPEAPQTSVE